MTTQAVLCAVARSEDAVLHVDSFAALQCSESPVETSNENWCKASMRVILRYNGMAVCRALELAC
jgi:hypothetical protein